MRSGTEVRSVTFSVRGGEMTSKKALVASSLSLCTASWLASGQGQAVHAADDIRGMDSSRGDEQVAQAVLYQYLSPISSVAEGNLATKKESKPLTYKVKRGDTLYQIGKVYGVDHRKLALLNRIKNPRLLQVGQVLKLPLTRKWIRVKEGETLESLAEKHKTSKKMLIKLNPDLAAAGSVYTGQVIAVPRPIKVKVPKVTGGPANRSKPETAGDRPGGFGKGGGFLPLAGRRADYQPVRVEKRTDAQWNRHMECAADRQRHSLLLGRAGHQGRLFERVRQSDRGGSWKRVGDLLRPFEPNHRQQRPGGRPGAAPGIHGPIGECHGGTPAF